VPVAVFKNLLRELFLMRVSLFSLAKTKSNLPENFARRMIAGRETSMKRLSAWFAIERMD
jgi:hypothetical protein